MTILVTGATGFVGAAVARLLVDQGAAVRVLVRESSDRRNIEGLNADVAVGDLRDRAGLERALKGCTGLIHAAADYRLWARRPQDLYDTNVGGTRNIMLAAAEVGVGRIVYTSSVAVLGLPADGRPGDEEVPVSLEDMIGDYKRSKYMAETEVRRLIVAERLPVVIVNPSTPIGPGDVKPTPTGRVIAYAAAGRIPGFVDTGLNIVHVEDVAIGHMQAFHTGRVGQRYILGGEDKTLAEILATVSRICDRPPPRLKLPHGAVLPVAYMMETVARLTGRAPLTTVDGVKMARKRMFFSSEKARRELDYVPSRPAEVALADAVAWFRANGFLRRS